MLLSQISKTLQDVQTSGRALKPSIIAYVFFPISTVLRRNPGNAIPDHLLEKLLDILSILCEYWWWHMDVKVWEQIFMLSGAVLGGIESKGKGKDRADETKEAAARCLWTLLRKRTPEDSSSDSRSLSLDPGSIFSTFQAHSKTSPFVPIVGQTVDSLLTTASSQHMSLVRTSLKVLQVLVGEYLSEDFVPTVFPGIVSGMCKIALAVGNAKTWANGDVVASAMEVLQTVVITAIGDEVCIKAGIIRNVNSLEDLAELQTSQEEPDEQPRNAQYTTLRTKSWLRGTSTQLHIALVTLRPLVSHPTSSAQLAVSSFSAAVLAATPLTLSQSQQLLVTYLLSLTHADYTSVSSHAKQALLNLLSATSATRHSLMQSLLQIAKDYLSLLPRVLSSHSDAKIEHAAQVVEAICDISCPSAGISDHPLRAVNVEVGRLLGATGGIERWGWSFLSVLSFTAAQFSPQSVSASHLMLESSSGAVQIVAFPELILHPLTSRPAQSALERMLRAMGNASGEDGLYAVEWFVNIGKARHDSRAVAALWCACRLIEGIGHINLGSVGVDFPVTTRRRKLERCVRGIARSIPDMWDDAAELPANVVPTNFEAYAQDSDVMVEHVKGMLTIRSPLTAGRGSLPSASRPVNPESQLPLRKALFLQVIAVCAGILQARFTPLLLHVLYPILHSLVAESPHLSSSALSALHYVTHFTSYASPANLLLSNFDYALDAVSRRLSRRWLDIDAPKVLVILVRLVGQDVVPKAGDVVEECFDRLDEYHGYDVLVDGLIAVLLEVVLVVGSDDRNFTEAKRAERSIYTYEADRTQFDSLFVWLEHRNEAQPDRTEQIRFDQVPHEAWSKKGDDVDHPDRAENPVIESPSTPTQALTKQIVSRSMYFLTHGSAPIRARILNVLSSAVPVLPETALLPSIHQAWPFILNRLEDPEPFVVAAATVLVQALADHVGDFMYKRVWDDVWPKFRSMLRKLETADSASALTRRGPGAVGTESAYTISHRLYRAMISTMTAAARGVQTEDAKTWEVIVEFRRFLHSQAHEDLQAHARDLYKSLSINNPDAVWFALSMAGGEIDSWTFLHNPNWHIQGNAQQILQGV